MRGRGGATMDRMQRRPGVGSSYNQNQGPILPTRL